MNGLLPTSLRVQLALFGLTAILAPLVILLVVVFATVEESSNVDTVLVGDNLLSIDTDETLRTAAVSRWVPLTAALMAVPAATAVWWWSGRAVRPVRDITTMANQIQAGSLDQRIALSGVQDEVQALGDSFDAMLDRLAEASTSQRQLIEDANHELRNPLAALAVNTEVMLRSSNPSLKEYRQSAERTQTLTLRMQTTVDDLLAGARARHLEVRQVDNDLVEITRRVVEEHQALAPHRTIVFTGQGSEQLGVDGPLVERALSNLVDNALTHSPEDTPVEVAIRRDDAGVHAVVTDYGDGLTAAQIEHIFDRYYRGSNAVGDGAGIGLAIVKQVAEAHGTIRVDSPHPAGRGSRFTLTFDHERVSGDGVDAS